MSSTVAASAYREQDVQKEGERQDYAESKYDLRGAIHAVSDSIQ
jgi:hypothetical protein